MPKLRYAELHCHSSYSFLDGASSPQHLVQRAAELGLETLALTDHGGFPGVVQFAQSARHIGLPVAIGTEITLANEHDRQNPNPAGEDLVLIARNANGYQSLSRAVGKAMLESKKKGHAYYSLEELAAKNNDSWLVLTGCRKGAVRRALEREPGKFDPAGALREIEILVSNFGRHNVAVELTNTGSPTDRERCNLLADLAKQAGVEAIVTGNVHYALPHERRTADLLAATRANMTLDQIDPYLPANGAYLRSPAQMLAMHEAHPQAISAAARLGAECSFDLALIAPNLPPFPVPEGHTEGTWLRELTFQRAAQRYGTRASNPKAWEQIDHELEVILQLNFPGYFLIVEEIVSFCHSNGIWCQGRGSAANSAVCFALGITAVDAVRHHMLFERFLSPGRSGPPDIDVDIESTRRELVIQHVYERYGRENAAQVANVITYRAKSAIRDAARALGYERGEADHWSKSVGYRLPKPQPVQSTQKSSHRKKGAQLDVSNPESDQLSQNLKAIPESVRLLAQSLQGLPRHLGIHSGGMVLCDQPVINVCPVEWARMPGRTVVQWDKDDCAEIGLVKFDLLGLGMLTALRLAFTHLKDRGIFGEDGQPLGLHNLPQEDPRIYELLQNADTIGVFQVESRAQMATLPRLKPRTFYDVVVEVALIRPGPIQGQSVSPYLKRRNGKEEVTYLHPLLKPALEKTLGVPLFQEQLMQIAMDTAAFTPAQADKLRKAMGSKRSHERMAELKSDLFEGMEQNGIGNDVAEQICDKLQGFAEFGFPESHAFSFAYLVYASAWLKVHHPEEFYMGILNAQPMGFYSPQTLVADARRHEVKVLPPDVTLSREKSRIMPTDTRKFLKHPLVDADPDRALLLGLSSIRGIGEAATQIVQARAEGSFADVADLARRARLSKEDLERLSSAGALESLNMGRRQGIWLAQSLGANTTSFQPTLPGTEACGTLPELPEMNESEKAKADVEATGISAFSYPTQFLRPLLDQQNVIKISDTAHIETEVRVKVAGIVTHRQRPHTAKGVTFISLEDETGLLNVVCSAGLWQRYREVALHSSGLIIRGMIERGDGATNFVADSLEELNIDVPAQSRDFR